MRIGERLARQRDSRKRKFDDMSADERQLVDDLDTGAGGSSDPQPANFGANLGV